MKHFADKYKALLDGLATKITSTEEQASFAELISDLEKLPLSSSPPSTYDSINLTPEDLEGLPPEVIRQLGLNESDYYEMELVRLINKAGGIISLDKLIILLYKEKGEIVERTPINAKLYRMTKKGMVFSVPGRKGVYSTHSMEYGIKDL